MADTLDTDALTKRFRERAAAVKNRPLPPVAGEERRHFIEQARENGMSVVKLERGQRLGDLYVSGNEVMSNGFPLAQGELILRGGAIVIPPVGTRQRQFPDVLGTHRLNLGDGYALHGTQAVSQLGRSVSHGCVRLANEDIARLYDMANVGDEVVIY